MNFFLLSLLSLLSLASALPSDRALQGQFTRWAQQHGRTYTAREFPFRFAVFKANLQSIEAHNAKNASFTMKANSMADLTTVEYQKLMLGFHGKAALSTFNSTLTRPQGKLAVGLPTTWDWRTKGAVTEVKNQQQCGSCWSFSTTGSTEGCHKIKTGSLVSLSEQNLMDCSDSYGNQGCDGGLMTQAMQYIIDNNGVDTEASYPYTAEDGTCSFNAANVGATLSSYVNVNQYDENDLQVKTNQGPVSVAIDASHNSFQFYSSGVYNEPDCSETQLDHGVLSIGWGVSSGTPYWLVKNSWGSDWGQNGFIWMSRNANNQCGIATAATLPQC